MTDHHVHVGWYTDGYHSPEQVWKDMLEAGVDEIWGSSTSTCAELHKLVVKEMRELKRLGGERVHPVLWLTPRMFRTYGLRAMLHSRVEWEAVGIHPESHPEWAHNKLMTQKAAEVAAILGVKMIVHTGKFENSEANVFRYLYEGFPNIEFVLAHGRPVEQAISILRDCPNTRVDTAFMPKEDIRRFIDAGFANRMDFGTDAPINMVFNPECPTKEYVRNCIDGLCSVTSEKEFRMITGLKRHK